MIRFVTLLALAAFAAPSFAQTLDVWSDASGARIAPRAEIADYRLVRLDEPALRAGIVQANDGATLQLALPLPDGGTSDVTVREASVMAPALQARYPSIRTYTAQGSAGAGRLSLTEHGFKGLLFGPEGTVVIDPSEPGSDVYLVYRAEDLILPEDLLGFCDHTLHGSAHDHEPGGALARRSAAIGETLRTYRMAVSARGEYVQANGGTVQSGLAAIAGAVNRMNAIYERDLAVTFELVADNDKIIYTDPETDPFEGTGTDHFGPNKASTDEAIGVGNYDIGHIIGFNEGGGVARLSAVCDDEAKAFGTSGVGNETSLFDLVVFPHEVGHMMGAPHTWVNYWENNGIEDNAAGVEPFTGHSIMGYGQFANGGDGRIFRPAAERIGFYFHPDSIRRMNSFARSGGGNTCGTNTATGNDVPVVTVDAAEYRIPVGTPFTLVGSATDASGTALSYQWTQMDTFRSGNGAVPLFRSFDPGAATERSFPDLGRFLAGEPYPDELLIDQAVPHTFQLTVRDNVAGAGAVGTAPVEIDVYDVAGPFRVTSQAIPVVYAPSAEIAVEWSTGGSEADAVQPVSVVDVLVTYDGGVTWEVVADDTPNDGTATFTAPAAGANGRVMVRAEGNVFYSVSAEPFAVGDAPTAEVTGGPGVVQMAPSDVVTATVSVANTSPTATLLYRADVEYPGASASAIEGGFEILTSDDDGGPAVSFEDISQSGTAVTFEGSGESPAEDDGRAVVGLPFPFPFYGGIETEVTVSTDGLVAFGASPATSPNNQPIPTVGGPDGFVAPFWDDLKVGAGAVYTGTLDDGRFVVQYERVEPSDVAANYSFQVLLSPDGTIEFQYGALNGRLTTQTIGVEGPGGDVGVQYAYDERVVASNTAIRFVTSPQWLSVVDAPTGSLAPGASIEIPLQISGVGFQDGQQAEAVLVVQTSAGAQAVTRLPVTLRVQNNPIDTEAGPALAEVSLARPNPTAGAATVQVALAAPARMTATVHDALGRRVAVLHDGPAAGSLDLAVDARPLPAGVYFVRVVGDGFAETRSFVVAR